MFAGLICEPEKPVEIMVAHPAISAIGFSSMITKRNPLRVVRTGLPDGLVSPRLPVADAARLASCRRGIEPIRIIIPRQRTSVPNVEVVASGMDEPMPMAF